MTVSPTANRRWSVPDEGDEGFQGTLDEESHLSL